jgi:hypothetical protein
MVQLIVFKVDDHTSHNVGWTKLHLLWLLVGSCAKRHIMMNL